MHDKGSSEGHFLYHTSCDSCGSSDGRAVYSNGSSYCFVCESWSGLSDSRNTRGTKRPKTAEGVELLEFTYTALDKRKIPEAIARQYNYGTGHDKHNKFTQVANYYNKDRVIVAQKLRYADKTFKFIGNSKEALLFGQQLWSNKGKKLTITEGEIDALSVATAFDGKYPVVSLKNGAQSAKKEIAEHLDWISGYEEIYLWFDNDDAGRSAVESVVKMLPAKKIRIIRHADYKDANELLTYKGKAGVVSAFYNADLYKPDDIVSPSDMVETIAEPVKIGFPYYFDKLTKLLYGRRFGEVITVGAGVAIGKTDFVMSQIAFDLQKGWRVATFMLEQSTRETLLRVAGKVNGCYYHLPNKEYDPEILRNTVSGFQDQLYMFDNFGSNDWDTIQEKIRYIHSNYDVRIFYIDNLTALNAHAEDERRNLDALMAEVAGVAKELDIWVLLVSHLNPPKSGASHEAGGKTEQAQFTGSRAIMRWSYTMLGIERNTLHADPIERNLGKIRVLKDRFSGNATGSTISFRYDQGTGIVHELDGDFEIEETDDDSDF